MLRHAAGRAPYEAVLTHGFVLDEDGRKMSKSLGNVIAPQDVMKQSGADILRLWVVASDYAEDLRIGPEILKHMSDNYRRLRNTLRYLLGALAGWLLAGRSGCVRRRKCPSWSAGCCTASCENLDLVVRGAIDAYDFHTMFTALHNFLRGGSVGVLFRHPQGPALLRRQRGDTRRRATRTVLDRTFDCLVRWLAPILCFTAEEAWLARHGDSPGRSVHLELFPAVPSAWHDPALGARWTELRELRRVVTGALEVERAGKAHRLQLAGFGRIVRAGAAPGCAARCRPRRAVHRFGGHGPARAARRPKGPSPCPMSRRSGSSWSPLAGARCERCWRVLPEVGHVAGHDDLCGRCAEVIDRGADSGWLG